MASCGSYAFHLSSSSQRTPLKHKSHRFKASLQPLLRNLQKNNIPNLIDVPKSVKETSVKLLDAFVDMFFEFVNQPLLPNQSNFAPVEEIGEAIFLTSIEGRIPDDFPEGVYIRNGSNPLFGGLLSAVSLFGRTSEIWVEGEGMLHALYLSKSSGGSNWNVIYNNKYVGTDTFLLEKERKKPAFLPAVEGDPLAVLSSFVLNMLRFGIPNKHMSNTNVFEHSGKLYSIAENYVPQEIDILTLRTLGNWDLNGAWTRPFTSHPKRAPGTGELVTIGFDAQKPYFVLGVISADGTKLLHKVDLKFNRTTIVHEIGVTERYNVVLDFPLIGDLKRVIRGGALIKYEKEEYARIGVMPRYGNAESIRWFPVVASCAFHIINCFEDGDEVVVMACRAQESIIPGPELGLNKFEWFSRGLKHIKSFEKNGENPQDGLLFTRAYEWRLNMKTRGMKHGNLTGTQFSMDFPFINGNFVGLKNKYAYTQVVDSTASSAAGMAKYGGLAKLYFEERKLEFSLDEETSEELVKVEYHMFPSNTFCSGTTFVPKNGAVEEDDGWILTFLHNEDINVSQVYIVDAKQLSREAVAKIALPERVPYGFHGDFMSNIVLKI